MKFFFFSLGTTYHHVQLVKDQSRKLMSALAASVSAMVPTCPSASALFRLLFLRQLLILEKHDQVQVIFVISDDASMQNGYTYIMHT